MGTVERIQIHPIKALDPVRVDEVKVLASGALEMDRRWALLDARGNFVNGKRKAAIHSIRAEYDLAKLEVTLDGETFSLTQQPREIEAYLSDRLGEAVELRENAETGFPDDTDSPGPTVASTASLLVVADWFGFELEQTRLRFRTNLEISGVDAFWEDRLYGGEVRIGDVTLSAVNPCQRCIVPSRDPQSLMRIPAIEKSFSKRFSDLREKSLPAWADLEYFSHFYRFAVNTRIAAGEARKIIQVGDGAIPIAVQD